MTKERYEVCVDCEDTFRVEPDTKKLSRGWTCEQCIEDANEANAQAQMRIHEAEMDLEEP